MRTKIEDIEENLLLDNNVKGHVEVLIKDNRISASKIRCLESDFVNLKLNLSENNIANRSPFGDHSLDDQSSIHVVLKNQQEQIE